MNVQTEMHIYQVHCAMHVMWVILLWSCVYIYVCVCVCVWCVIHMRWYIDCVGGQGYAYKACSRILHQTCWCTVHKITWELVIQWNLSKPDTTGTEESFLNSEVSSFQGLQLGIFGAGKLSCLWQSTIISDPLTHTLMVGCGFGPGVYIVSNLVCIRSMLCWYITIRCGWMWWYKVSKYTYILS